MLRKFSDDGQTDRQTDGQTDEIDFIRRCPTDVERPINEFAYLLNLELPREGFVLNRILSFPISCY